MSDITKPSIPRADGRFEHAVKENIEIITGQRGDKIKRLDTTATQADIIEKINELLNVLQ